MCVWGGGRVLNAGEVTAPDARFQGHEIGPQNGLCVGVCVCLLGGAVSWWLVGIEMWPKILQ